MSKSNNSIKTSWNLDLLFGDKSKENLAKLADFNHTVLACINCHDKMEADRELTERVFKKLRPKTIANG